MQERLTRKFHAYLRNNHPDLLLALQEEKRVTDYLQENLASVESQLDQLVAEGKLPSLIEEIILNELNRPLKPSRYNYIKAIVEEEFPESFEAFQNSGVLTTELINLIAYCDDLFDELNFSVDTEEDRDIKHAIIGRVSEYIGFNPASRD